MLPRGILMAAILLAVMSALCLLIRSAKFSWIVAGALAALLLFAYLIGDHGTGLVMTCIILGPAFLSCTIIAVFQTPLPHRHHATPPTAPVPPSISK
jgi:hypothetical protein